MLPVSVYLLIHQLEIAVSGCLGEGRQAQGCAPLYQPMTMFAVIASHNFSLFLPPFLGKTDSIDMYMA